VKNSRSLAEKW